MLEMCEMQRTPATEADGKTQTMNGEAPHFLSGARVRNPRKSGGQFCETAQRCCQFVCFIGLLLAAFAGEIFADDDGWSVASRSPEITVYERTRKGSALLEFKAVGVMPMSPEVIKRVIDDVDQYPRFMPYVTEARVLSRDGANLVSYQRISPPFVSDRDYTVRVNCETRRDAGGICFCNRWKAANHLGPAEKKGVSRVTITEGSWLLDPDDAGRKTRATYHIFSDSGGALPATITNAASRTAIPKLFESIRKQAQLPRYLGAR